MRQNKKATTRRRKFADPVPVEVVTPTVQANPLTSAGLLTPSPDIQKDKTSSNLIVVQNRSAGSSGTHIYGGYFAEEYLVNILHGTAAADVYDKMRRSDAKIKMALNAVKTPIKSANWEIRPGDDTDEAKLHAQFIEHVLFHDMDRPFSKNEMLTIADFGYSVFEVTHKPVLNHPTFGSYIGLKALGWRSPRSILTWNLDPNTGAVRSVRQLITGDLGRWTEIPGEFLLVATLEKEGDNYEGISLLRAAYGAWARKNLYLKLMAIGIERNAVPTPTVEVPSGQQNSVDYDNLILALENLTSHQSSYLTFPAGWKLDSLKNNFDPDKVKLAVEFENSELVSAFMANFLLLGSTQSGSRAVSMDQSQFFLGAIQYVADEAVSPINHTLIPNLIKMKFGPQEKYPLLTVSGISDKAGLELGNTLKALAETQYIQPDDELEEHLRKRFSLPKKSDKGVRFVTAPKAMAPASNVVSTDNPDKFDQPVRHENAEGHDPRRITLASARAVKKGRKAREHIALSKDSLKNLMKERLSEIASSLVSDLISQYRKLPPAQKRTAVNNVVPKGIASYKSDLVNALGSVALKALNQARMEVPGKKNIKLFEAIESTTLSDFDKLPKAIQTGVSVTSGLLADTQSADLQKALFFQFGSSIRSTADENILENDLADAAESYVNGGVVATASGTSVSQIVNETRDVFFSDPEVLSDVQAFEYVNGDPQCPLCMDLDGSVFEADDASALRYYPPLHHNCNCVIVPILTSEPTREITGLSPSKASLEDYISLSEKSHG